MGCAFLQPPYVIGTGHLIVVHSARGCTLPSPFMLTCPMMVTSSHTLMQSRYKLLFGTTPFPSKHAMMTNDAHLKAWLAQLGVILAAGPSNGCEEGSTQASLNTKTWLAATQLAVNALMRVPNDGVRRVPTVLTPKKRKGKRSNKSSDTNGGVVGDDAAPKQSTMEGTTLMQRQRQRRMPVLYSILVKSQSDLPCKHWASSRARTHRDKSTSTSTVDRPGHPLSASNAPYVTAVLTGTKGKTAHMWLTKQARYAAQHHNNPNDDDGASASGLYSIWSPDVGIITSAQLTVHHHRGRVDYSGNLLPMESGNSVVGTSGGTSGGSSDGSRSSGGGLGKYLADQMPEWTVSQLHVAYKHAGIGDLSAPLPASADCIRQWIQNGPVGNGMNGPLEHLPPGRGCVEIFSSNDAGGNAHGGDGAGAGGGGGGGADTSSVVVRFGPVDQKQPTGAAIYSKMLTATTAVGLLGTLLPFQVRTLAGDIFEVHCNPTDDTFDIEAIILAQHPRILGDASAGGDINIVGMHPHQEMTRSELAAKLQQPGADGVFVVVHGAPPTTSKGK